MKSNKYSNCLNTGNAFKAYTKDGKQRVKVTRSFDCELQTVVFEVEDEDEDPNIEDEIEIDEEKLKLILGNENEDDVVN